MSDQSRFMLVVSPLMENSPAFDRAAALAKASGAALHIVAFDYLEGLATAGMVNGQALEQMRLCLLYTSPSPRDRQKSRMPSSA